jgi:L-asparaginase II
MPHDQPFPLVEVTRGSIIESTHYGSLAIAQPDGKIVFSLGDISSPVFLRSAAKPFQALAFLEAGGVERYALTEKEIAIMCASHTGTDDHVRVLEALQEKIGITESMLQCGIHAPYHSATAREKMLKGEAFHPNQNDCAGKHSGMLAFAKMIGAPMDSYLEPAHPVQQAMLKTFAEMCRVELDSIELGTDGCSAPVFAVPLKASAGAYARLCQPDEMTAKRADACRVITAAMRNQSFMIAGPQRFDTDLMTVAGGSVVSKIGAEGVNAIGVLPGKAARFKTSLGITIKICDGDLLLRAGCVAAIEALQQLGVLSAEQTLALFDHGRRPLKNWRGTVIGEIRPSAELVQALTQALA